MPAECIQAAGGAQVSRDADEHVVSPVGVDVGHAQVKPELPDVVRVVGQDDRACGRFDGEVGAIGQGLEDDRDLDRAGRALDGVGHIQIAAAVDIAGGDVQEPHR